MKVSILISTYNGENDIDALLKSIKNLDLGTYDVEVIIRDDNSTDKTVDRIAQYYSWVILIKGEENLGFAKSNNIAFQYATGQIICCVNQDTILDTNFLIEGLSILENNPHVVGLNTNMIMPWIISIEEFNKLPRTTIPAFEYQLSPFGFIQYEQAEPKVHETNFMTGGGFFLRRSALRPNEELFAPDLDMYCEDTELSLRILKRGQKIIYVPKAVLYHNQRKKEVSSLSELKKLLKITKNRFVVVAKHQHPLEFTLKYPLYGWGIVLKMGHLGLRGKNKYIAYIAGGAVCMIFFLLFPYIIWLAVKNS